MLKIPTSIAMGISLFLLIVTIGGILIWQSLSFGIDAATLKTILIILFFGVIFISALFIIQIIIDIIITKTQNKRFERDYAIIIKCKKCGTEFRKTECPTYCPNCNELLRLSTLYIVVGLFEIIFALLFTFFILTHLSRTKNLHIAFPLLGLFILFGINFIMYGTGKKKIYQFTFGLSFFLVGLFVLFTFLSSGDSSFPTILIGITFAILGIYILSGRAKLMTEKEVVENLPKKGIGGLFKKIFKFKNRF